MRYIVLIIFLGIISILGGCASAGKNFDESKISKIANGITTRAELRKMFGEPFKTGVQNGQPVWVYEYNLYDAVNNDTSKDLIIVFGPNGLVQSHQFMSNEPTP